jgi:putative ABC transport system substrate-binding protein
MDRRTFLSALTGSLFTAPLAAEAQQVGKVYRVGLLRVGTPPPNYIEPFRQGVSQVGYVEGQNIVIEYGLGRSVEQLPDIAAGLVRLKVDVLVASGTRRSCRPATPRGRSRLSSWPLSIPSG